MSADAIVAAALPLEGLSYGSDPNRYDAALFPTDTDVQAKQMGSIDYSCALTARAVCRMAEVDGRIQRHGRTVDVLREPYANLTALAVAILIELAQAHGLWNHAPTADDMQPGTVVIVDAPVHVMTITGRSEADGVIALETIEGGNVDPQNANHGTAIRRKSRQVVTQGGKLIVGRAVLGCFAAGDLPCLPADTDDTEPSVALAE